MIRASDPSEPTGAPGLSAEAMEQLATRIRDLEKEGYTVGTWVLHPGEAYRAQVSDDDKILAVLKGSAHLELPTESRDLTPGAVVNIPHGLVHSLTVKGERDVYILVAHREPRPIPPEAFRGGS
jgi:quercetin dioxygenase-like cupin family protein